MQVKTHFSPLNIVAQRDVVIHSVHLGDDNVWIREQLRNRERVSKSTSGLEEWKYSTKTELARH